MLSYQHIYHAGNFADAHKHTLLARVMIALKNKHARLTVIDTHAGRGFYDLASEEAQKTGEYKNGIIPLRQAWKSPSPIDAYMGVVQKFNPEDGLSAYPGSSMIAHDLLRANDRFIFAELHPGERAELQKNFAEKKNVEIVGKDGFAVLAENTPPQGGTGVAIIDPSYEIKTDYAAVPRHIQMAWKKWPQGVFFLWYPILSSGAHHDMLLNLRKTVVRHVLISEIKLPHVPEQGFAMMGSGIAIVNPPLNETAVRDVAQYVARSLPHGTEAETFWLDNRSIDPATGMLSVTI